MKDELKIPEVGSVVMLGDDQYYVSQVGLENELRTVEPSLDDFLSGNDRIRSEPTGKVRITIELCKSGYEPV